MPGYQCRRRWRAAGFALNAMGNGDGSLPFPATGCSAATRSSDCIGVSRESYASRPRVGGSIRRWCTNAGESSPNERPINKAPRSARGAQQHRHSFTSGTSNRASGAISDALCPATLPSRVSRRYEERAQFALASSVDFLGFIALASELFVRHTLPLRDAVFQIVVRLSPSLKASRVPAGRIGQKGRRVTFFS